MSAGMVALLVALLVVCVVAVVVLAFFAGRGSVRSTLVDRELSQADRVWLEQVAPDLYRVSPPSEYEQLLHEEWVTATSTRFTHQPVIFYRRDDLGQLVKRTSPDAGDPFELFETAGTTPLTAGTEAGASVPASPTPVRAAEVGAKAVQS